MECTVLGGLDGFRDSTLKMLDSKSKSCFAPFSEMISVESNAVDAVTGVADSGLEIDTEFTDSQFAIFPESNGRDNGGEGVCFSADATVYVENSIVPVPMDELKVGDYVMTGNGMFEPVYSFGHRHRTRLTKFLRLHSSASSVPLEITSEHLVYVHGKGGIRADEVAVGDKLVCSNRKESGECLVSRIASVTKEGIYAPLTASGTIVVQDVVASVYPGVHTDNAHVGAGIARFLKRASTVHALTAPYRVACLGISDAFCSYEYNATGMNAYVAFADALFTWWEQLSSSVLQMVVLIVAICFSTVFCLIELVGGPSYGPVIVSFASMIAWKRFTMACECKSSCIKIA